MRKLQDLTPSFLILGAKEYPFGAGAKEDVFASGGMEVYTEQLAQLLARRGVKVTVITRKFAHQSAHEVQKGVEIRRVAWLKGFLLRNPSFNLNALREMFFLPRRSCNTIVANGVIATLTGIVASWFKRIFGERVKVIARPAGIAWVQPQYNFVVKSALLMLETTAYKLADAVVFLSQPEKEQFVKKMGFLPKRNVIIPTGVDPQRFKSANGAQVRKQLGVKKDGKLIVFVGRLIE
ncbi:MAG: glycosyltransferase family 4 protein, partial [Candidatus Micrarchaeia archaeon]